MQTENRYRKPLIIALFAVYLAVLVYVVLFKAQPDVSALQFRSLNLIPFTQMISVRGRFGFDFVMNVLVFAPFGVYMTMLWSKRSILLRLLPIFAVSLLFEILQYIFALGASDINDLISNTLGGLLGIGAYALAKKMFKEKTERVCLTTLAVGTVLVVLVLVIFAGSFQRMYNSEENRAARAEILESQT